TGMYLQHPADLQPNCLIARQLLRQFHAETLLALRPLQFAAAQDRYVLNFPPAGVWRVRCQALDDGLRRWLRREQVGVERVALICEADVFNGVGLAAHITGAAE